MSLVGEGAHDDDDANCKCKWDSAARLPARTRVVQQTASSKPSSFMASSFRQGLIVVELIQVVG